MNDDFKLNDNELNEIAGGANSEEDKKKTLKPMLKYGCYLKPSETVVAFYGVTPSLKDIADKAKDKEDKKNNGEGENKDIIE